MRLRNYQNELLKQLKNSVEAAEYLNACYQESEEVFLVGLRNVVEAQGGFSLIAKKAKLNRENLYRMLSKEGNPKLHSLNTILEALNISLLFKSQKNYKKAA